jgi:hypothetical protein
MFEYIRSDVERLLLRAIIALVSMILLSGTVFTISVAHYLSSQNKKDIGKIEYKFQDTLEFCDKDTDEIVKKLDNVEFRVLGKDTYMYIVKTPYLPSPEVLIMNQFPPNTYLTFRQTTVEEMEKKEKK